MSFLGLHASVSCIFLWLLEFNIQFIFLPPYYLLKVLLFIFWHNGFSFDIKLPCTFSSTIISPKTFILEVDNFLVESKFLELFLIHCLLGNHWYDILSIERGFQHSLRLGYTTYFKPQFQCPVQTFIKIHFVTRLQAIKWDVILW